MALSLSCSNSDDNKEKVYTYFDIMGNWNYSELIYPDGSKVPYQNFVDCPSEKSYVEIENIVLKHHRFGYQCNNYVVGYANYPYLFENRFTGDGMFGDFFENGLVEKLTSTELIITFNVPRSSSSIGIGDEVSGIVLTKRVE
ncbi:hypothetical protein [Flavobacterium sp.]|uniref:hypothetical protein n=1 Tax=Flavobacterium sp. TaxID=239 RepID=UPI0037BEBD2E